MDIQSTLYPLLNDLIILMGTILLGFVTAYVKSHYSAKQVETAKKVADISVSFADEMAHVYNISGPEKFNTAITQAKVLAGKAGIKLSDEQWTALIKAVVNEGRTVYDATQGAVPIPVESQPIGIITDISPEAAITPLEPSIPVVETITPTDVVPAPQVAPDIQNILNNATVVYNQYLTDSMQVLSTQTK